MNIEKKKGFTLIELLIVIAVIALMAAIVVSALGDSRSKGSNAAIKSNMRTIGQQVELVYVNTIPNGYGTAGYPIGSCPSTVAAAGASVFADAVIIEAILETQRQTLNNEMPLCTSTTTQWAMSALLKKREGGNDYWCIETEGKAKGQAAGISTTACN